MIRNDKSSSLQSSTKVGMVEEEVGADREQGTGVDSSSIGYFDSLRRCKGKDIPDNRMGERVVGLAAKSSQSELVMMN